MSSSSPETAPSSDTGTSIDTNNNNNNKDDNSSSNNNDGDSSQSPPSPPPPNQQATSPPPPPDQQATSPPPPPDQQATSPPPPPHQQAASPPPPPHQQAASPPPMPSSDQNSSSSNSSDSGSSSNNQGSSGSKSPSPSSSPPRDNNNNNNNNNNGNKSSGSGSSGSSSSSTPNLTPKSSGGSNKQSPPAALSGYSENSSGDKNDDSRAVIGALVGVGIVLLMMLAVCIFRYRRKRRKHRYYYSDDIKPSKTGSNYYNRGHNANNWRPGGNDHVVRMQQSPGMGMGMGMGPDSGGWGPIPPPPPPHSTDMSSNYSSLGPPPPPSPPLSLGLNCGTFSFEDLAAATESFADKNMIGQGGFGYVYKGVLPNGKEVAVKSLKAGSGQGEREFQAEIEIISRVHHRHLVSLQGYCIAGGQRMLVYEFVPNDTLEHHLHGKGLPTMTWRDRMRIAVGSAKGLAYLHEDCHPRIIHRDIKSANVLLDDSFEAKVADFGLAKLTTDNNTHVSTRVMGTFGYLAPEYASSGKLTEKSDVFSFGVMLLEIITGKRPIDIQNMMDDSLVDWARPLLAKGLEDGNFEELVDPFLEGNYNNQELSRMAACASASIRHSGKKRPKMSQIVRALEGDVSLDDLNDTRVGHSRHVTSTSSSDYDTTAYQADMKRFRQIALASQEFGSSESSGEMSQNPRQHL